MQDPKIMELIGQNPAAQQMMSGLMAHIAEHAAFSYRIQIEKMLGVPLPAMDEEDSTPISAQDEKNLAPLIAQAAQRVMIQNQAQQAQQANQQAAQNPELQMQQQELQLRQQELQRKEADSVRDFQIAQQKLELERQRLIAESQKEMGRLSSQERQNDKRIRADMMKQMIRPQRQVPPKRG
jgi:DNA anti-recombination protein RmuC